MEIPGRDDVTEDLVHFVKGEDDETAFAVLAEIVEASALRGGDGFIKGGYLCVCFTEAPLGKIGPTIVAAQSQGRRYRAFGIIVEKAWLYNHGGRPVIYQHDQEYSQLPEPLRWRHVRYEPTSTPPTDWTWEREWRIRAKELPVFPGTAHVLLPDPEWRERFFEEWDRRETLRREQMRHIGVDDGPQRCPWQVRTVT